MGAVRMGPPTDFVLFLRENFQIRRFVETGTFRGNTAIWASKNFESVATVENSRTIHQELVRKYAGIRNIRFVFGNSIAFLAETIEELSDPTIFWIDSHWCGGESYGENDQCPLLFEIAELNRSPQAHFILIDDARLFLSPPPYPNQTKYWPAIDQVIDALRGSSNRYYIAIFEDVIVAVPEYARELVAAYYQKKNTESWLESGNMANKSSAERGLGLILEGCKMIAANAAQAPSRLVQAFSRRSQGD